MKEKLKGMIKRFNDDEAGAMSVEKILILAVIAVPLIIVIVLFAKKAKEWFGEQETTLESNKF
jgi:Flp pilus assembly pilin Flp